MGEQGVRVKHVLLGLPEASLDDIDIVYSHPQALMQCSNFLENMHKDWTKKSIKNTAGSALKVKEDGLKNQAGIASKKTAEIYGLKVLADAIQDNKHNSTRFIIV